MIYAVRYLALILFCLSSAAGISQTYEHIDSITWGDVPDGSTSGMTVGGVLWTAVQAGGNSDGTGSFGVSGNSFLIQDTEGTEGCLCGDGSSTNCGQNDNNIFIPSVVVTGYCRVRVSLHVSTSGNLECGNNPNDLDTGCPSALGADWNDTDALVVAVTAGISGDVDQVEICGENNAGLVELDVNVDTNDLIALIINTGTQQADEFYRISSIKFEGLAREFPSLDMTLTTPNQVGPNTICEDNGAPIMIQMAANSSNSQSIDWFNPFGIPINGDDDSGTIAINTYDTFNTGDYSVTVIDNNGCSNSEVIFVTVLHASDSICQAKIDAVFSLDSIHCSDFVLPGTDDNGIIGVWSPSDVLAPYDGMTLDFTFTPDDASVNPFTMEIAILAAAESILSDTICGGENYMFGDQMLTSSGSYRDTLTAASGCDSIVMLNLAVSDNIFQSGPFRICSGESYQVGNSIYDSTGVYLDTFPSSSGCDSIVSTEIIVSPLIESFRHETICSGDSITIQGRTYTETTQDEFRFQSANGCDSLILYLDVIKQDIINETVFESICVGDSFQLGDSFYTESGDYFDTLTTGAGCDSIVVIILTVFDLVRDSISDEICTGSTYDFGGIALTESGVYLDTIPLMSGCEGIVELTLSVVDQIETQVDAVICNGENYPWMGLILDSGGTYRDTLKTSDNCDSIVTLELTILADNELTFSDVMGSCEGSASGSFTIEDIPGTMSPFSISGIDGITMIDQLPFTVTGLDSGTYTIEIMDAGGCSVVDSVSIPLGSSETLSIIANKLGQGQYQLFLDYNGGIVSITWDNDPGLSCYDCPNPMASIDAKTTYDVSIVDANGCTSTASITLDVTRASGFYTGNVISPNSPPENGNNLLYLRSARDSRATYVLRVFDRWGNQIFEVLNAPVNNPQYGWDGRYSDQVVDSGVYIYTALIRENGTEEIKNGSVLVVN